MTLSTCSLGGDDVTDGGAGLDVLDGGFGWNFLTGGTGADAFFLDGRAGVMTWSTITDFSSEDNVNIWGWQEGVSKLITSLENRGLLVTLGRHFTMTSMATATSTPA